MRSMVEGAARLQCNSSKNSVQIFQDFNSRNSEQAMTLATQKIVAARISGRLVTTIVGFSVNLNDQARLRNIKVDNVRTDRVLLAHAKAKFV